MERDHTQMNGLRVLVMAIAAVTAPGVSTANSAISGVVTTAAKAGSGTLKVTKDNQICGASVPDESVVVNGGKLSNAVIYLEGAKGVAPSGKAELDQRQCRYAPHVQAVTKGTELAIKNGDATMHNVHSYVGDNRTLFNLATPLKDFTVKKTLGQSGLVTIKCDAGHTWMSAFIYVFDHQYFAVSAKDGSFTIKDVPPGTYKLTVWHEKLGTKSTTVTVGAETATVDLSL